MLSLLTRRPSPRFAISLLALAGLTACPAAAWAQEAGGDGGSAGGEGGEAAPAAPVTQATADTGDEGFNFTEPTPPGFSEAELLEMIDTGEWIHSGGFLRPLFLQRLDSRLPYQMWAAPDPGTRGNYDVRGVAGPVSRPYTSGYPMQPDGVGFAPTSFTLPNIDPPTDPVDPGVGGGGNQNPGTGGPGGQDPGVGGPGVPEPASFALLAAGAGLLLGRRRAIR